jgi:hypothetical protein
VRGTVRGGREDIASGFSTPSFRKLIMSLSYWQSVKHFGIYPFKGNRIYYIKGIRIAFEYEFVTHALSVLPELRIGKYFEIGDQGHYNFAEMTFLLFTFRLKIKKLYRID